MSAKPSPRRVAAWAAAALLLVLAWWGVSALVVAVDEAGVPPASALSPELRAVAQGDGDTECGSGGCWRTWETSFAEAPTQDAAERCTGLNLLPFRKSCTWLAQERGAVTVNVRYSP